MRNAICLGGPWHGKRLVTSSDSSVFRMVKTPDLYAWMATGAALDIPKEITCQVVDLRIGNHVRSAVLYPDIRANTGERLLADYIVQAWDAYDITHNGKRGQEWLR